MEIRKNMNGQMNGFTKTVSRKTSNEALPKAETNKKRVVTICIIIVTLSLGGCGKKENKEKKIYLPSEPMHIITADDTYANEESVDFNTDQVEEASADQVNKNQIGYDEILMKNGSFSSAEGIDDFEKSVYINEIVEATKNLDFDTLSMYSSRDISKYRDKFETIRNNPVDLEFWNNTIGLLRYYPKSDILIGKSVKVIYAKWYADCLASETFPEQKDVEELGYEYAQYIYEKYYKTAPYCSISDLADQLSMYIDAAGYVKCYPEQLLDVLWIGDLESLLFNYVNSTPLNYCALLLGYDADLSTSPSEIEGNCSNYSSFLEKNLDGMLDTIKPDHGEIYLEVFEEYYENEEKRKIIQDYLNEYCEFYRTPNSILMLIPETEYSYPFCYADDTEIKEIFCNEEGLVRVREINQYTTSVFTTFYDLTEDMKNLGLLT